MPSYLDEDGERVRTRMGRTSDGVWYCQGHDFETESKREYDEHRRRLHETFCGMTSCRHLAAYKYFNGKYYVPYCPTHAASAWEDNGAFRERPERVTRPANEDAPRLPEDHPLEESLSEDADD